MKNKTIFVCNSCGNESTKWLGKCPVCQSWNSMSEEIVYAKSKDDGNGLENFNDGKVVIERLEDISEAQDLRINTNIEELNRVLGGGIVQGSLTLVGGSPGVGKSTLLLQLCQTIDKENQIIYISGEESKSQIKMRAGRLNVHNNNLFVVTETNIDMICKVLIKQKPDIAIIDSVQTMYSSDIPSSAGSVTQIKEVTLRLMEVAKKIGTSIFLVGHITKDGAIAGPKILEHMVDCVLLFESENHKMFKILRTIKNRFGSTNEIGVFEMRSTGLIEVNNPSQWLLQNRTENVSGSCIVCCMEGMRCILAEVQALVSHSPMAIPRRTSTGIDSNRLLLLVAVLEKRLGLRLSNQEIYLNIAGGIRIFEPSADLAIVTAIISSLKDLIVQNDIIFIGEVGLNGEIRPISHLENRIKEVKKMGFSKCIVPYANRNNVKEFESQLSGNIEIVFIKNLNQLMEVLK